MIYVKISGRLGNQMFYYAMMRRVQILNKINTPAVMDFSEVYEKGIQAPNEKGFEDSLQIFNVVPYECIHNNNELSEIRLFKQPKIKTFEYKCLKKLVYLSEKSRHREWICKIQTFFHKVGIYYVDYLVGHVDYTRIGKSLTYDVIIEGRFENANWFNPIRDQLLLEFTPKEERNKDNEELYRIIENTESVCVSIRRGDYVSNPGYKKIFNVCDENYFFHAVEEIKQRVNNPVFIIFSDDVDWCKKNIKLKKEIVYYESGNDSLGEKLLLCILVNIL